MNSGKVSVLVILLVVGTLIGANTSQRVISSGHVDATSETAKELAPESSPDSPPPLSLYYVDAVNGNNTTGDGGAGNPWQTITYALSQTFGSNIEIRVAPGVYNQTLGEIFPITMKSGISLVGAGYSKTIISGTNASSVVFIPGTTFFLTSTVLSGFKIAGGSEGVHVDGIGGAGSAPTIQGNWITGNADGIVVSTWYGQRAYPWIKDDLVSYNTNRGIFAFATHGIAIAAPTIENTTISNNNAEGIYCYATGSGYPYNGDYGVCSPVVIRSRISNNTSHGFLCHTAYTGGCSEVIESTVVSNNGGWGIGRRHDVTYLMYSYPEFINNMISDNASGGALFSNGVDVFGDHDGPEFVNDTIAYNNLIGIQDGYPTIVNCILWGHSSDTNASTDVVSYSDVGQGPYYTVNNNVSLDPRFVNRNAGNFHLRSDSPVINLGNNGAKDLPTFDFDGNRRIIGPAVDMGADEVNYGPIFLPSVFNSLGLP